MTNPRHARETENGRYYEIPGVDRQLVSVTNANSVALAKYGLPLWYANLATDAAWSNLPRMAYALRRPPCEASSSDDRCGVCRDCVTRDIKGAAEASRDSASALGSRVHDLAEAHVLGRPIDEMPGDDEAGLYVAQYMRFLEDFEVDLERDVVATEMTVYDDHAGYAGTLDVILRLPMDGWTFTADKTGVPRLGKTRKVTDPEQRGRFLLDIKTSRKRGVTQSYPENVLQVTALRHAKRLVLPDDTTAPMVTGITGTGTIQLRSNRYAVIPLPSRTQEMRTFLRVLEMTRWVHDVWPGDYDYRPISPSGTQTPKRQRKADQ